MQAPQFAEQLNLAMNFARARFAFRFVYRWPECSALMESHPARSFAVPTMQPPLPRSQEEGPPAASSIDLLPLFSCGAVLSGLSLDLHKAERDCFPKDFLSLVIRRLLLWWRAATVLSARAAEMRLSDVQLRRDEYIVL